MEIPASTLWGVERHPQGPGGAPEKPAPVMRASRAADLWWRTALVYCLDVETYADSDGDGCGDFRGLTERLEHLDRLGVTCLWLMPFFPTGGRDDGYDITDYYGIDPRLGTFGDFVEFMRTARSLGIKVIADLVVNHTSDRHPWFRESRRSRDNPRRDWYVWRDERPVDHAKGVVFPDQEDSLWELDTRTGQYYFHRFYRSQPDLNIANPQVRDEIARIVGFWMELGLAGCRVDAVPFLLETEGVKDAEQFKHPHGFLRDLRAFMGRRDGSSVLLGEVNLPYRDAMRFFGDEADELTMLFDFPGMQAMYLALVRQRAAPLTASFSKRPLPPKDGHWATFVRNHDELTLDKLTEKQRQEVFAEFGPDPDMQLYGRGLRRRLPPMLGGDQARIRMVYSLLFSLPGTPVLFYGEEIGMGENLDIPGRASVRTPMQWDDSRNGGFSTAPPSRLPAAPPSGAYGPDHVSVADQRDDPASLLTWFTLLSRRYRECPELGWGELSLVEADAPSVFAHVSRLDGSAVLAVHNLADRAVDVTLTVPELAVGHEMRDLLVAGPGIAPPVTVGKGHRVRLGLERYGCRWLR